MTKIKISVVTPTIRPEGLRTVYDALKAQTFQDFEWLVEVNTSGKPDFNSAMNKMLRRATGELVVSVQDFIAPLPDALEKCWNYYNKYPDRFVTCNPQNGDWRQGEERKVNPTDWEIDFGFAGLKELKKIGGFDEYLEEGTWGFDNVNVGVRACLAGYTIWCTPDIKAVSTDHERKTFRDQINPDWHNARLQEFVMGLQLPPLP